MGVVKGAPRGMNQLFRGSIINMAIDDGVKGHTIPLDFSPTSLSDSLSASFQQTTIPGGYAPQITFSNTGARQVTLALTIPLDYLPANSDFNNTEEYLDAFRALVYPRYDGTTNFVKGPYCQLTLSNIELKEAVCTACSIDYKTDRYGTNGAMAADVSLSFTEILSSITESKDIAGKTTILGTTTITNTSSGSNTSSSSSETSYELHEVTTNIKLNGSVYNETSGAGAGPDFDDPLYTHTSEDIWSVARFYAGSSNSKILEGIDTSSLSLSGKNIVGKAGGVTLTFERNNENVYTYLTSENEKVYYIILYVPFKDANTYDFTNSKARYITHTTKIK